MTYAHYQTFVFDCDGVLLDSNKLKTDAFHAVTQPEFGEAAAMTLVAYHKANGGLSRYHKFRYLLESILKLTATEEKVQQLAGKYGDWVREKLVVCPEIPGAMDFVASLAPKACYVISGGDEKELRWVFAERGQATLFREIFGSPTTKPEHLQNLQKRGLLTLPARFFGDAKADFMAAKGYGLDFTFVKGATEWLDWERQLPLQDIEVIDDFR